MSESRRIPRVTVGRAIAVLSVPLVIVGVAFAVGVIGLPSVAGVEDTFGPVDEEETVIESTAFIDNPNPFGTGTEAIGIDYAVTMEGVRIATGSPGELAIGSGTDSINLSTTMENRAITEWWPRHVAAGEVTSADVDIELTMDRFNRSVSHTHTTSVETDLLSGFRSDEPRPIDADRPIVDDPILYINETDAAWGSPTETTTPIDMTFLVHNPNPEPYAIAELGYEITMNDVSVGTGATDEAVLIAGHDTEPLDLDAEIDARALDDWWVSHLEEDPFGHQVSELRIEFWAVIELPTGDEVTIDLDPLTYEEFVGTDVFDEGGDVGVPPSDPDEEGDEPTDGADDADDGADEEPIEDPADDGTDDATDENDATDEPADDSTDDGGTDDTADDSAEDDDDLIDDLV